MTQLVVRKIVFFYLVTATQHLSQPISILRNQCNERYSLAHSIVSLEYRDLI